MFKKYCFLWALLPLLPTLLSAQWGTLQLSETKFYTQAAAVDDKAVFIGGAKPGFVPSNKLEVYDFVANAWQTALLTSPRILSGVAVADSLVFIAGGLNPQTGAFFKRVDIYDARNNTWRPAQNLSVARASAAAVRVGDEMWFAGGYTQSSPTAFVYYDVIDVYGLSTGLWSTRTLSTPRLCSGAVLGDKVVFAGGDSNVGPSAVVDIFDTASQQWDTAQLSVARFNTAMATAGPYLLVAGGSTYTDDALNTVDLWNTELNVWTTDTLSAPRALIGAATACGTTAIFAGGGAADWDTKQLTASSDRVDLFDASTETWTQDTLSHLRVAAFAAASETRFFVGAGWYPEGPEFLKSVEVYTCPDSWAPQLVENVVFKIFPNPGSDGFWLELAGGAAVRQVEVLDWAGRLVATCGGVRCDLPVCPAGTYRVRVTTDDGRVGWRSWVKL